jgi:hypothetical protein
MANPLVHSKSSVKRWKGSIDDYLPIHEFLDSVKGSMNNNSSRLITHNTWFCYNVIPKVFGYNIINSDGKSIDTVDIAMLHVAEDFRMKFVPTLQDYLTHLNIQSWMNNGLGMSPSEESEKTLDNLLDKIKNE